MQITRQADYALRAILYLSRLAPNERAATKKIAEEQKIPPSFLAKIISQLSIANSSTRHAEPAVVLCLRAPLLRSRCSRLWKPSMDQLS